MADTFFSINFKERYLTFSEARKEGDLLDVISLGKTDIITNYYNSDLEKDIEAQANLIVNLVKNFKISKKNVNIIIPNLYTYHQILETPILKEKELISAMKYQADQFIPMPIDETNIDLEIIKEDKVQKKLLILVVAAPKKLIEKIQTTVELAGLIPESIETELSSSCRFVSELLIKSKKEKNFILVDFGYTSSQLSYFENDLITSTHNVSIGYQLFLKELMVNGNLDEKKATEILKNFSQTSSSSLPIETIISPLLNEIKFEIQRFISSKNPNAIYFADEIINFPGLTSFITKDFSLPVEILNPTLVLKKTSLVNALNYELPLYIEVFGGNLR